MARPRKNRDQKRSEILRFRLRPSELSRLQKAARAGGLSLSDFVRAILIDGRLRVIQEVRTFDADLYDELRRIGVNLNQAVHKFHATGDAPPQLVRAAAAVEKVVMDLIDK
jgi:uncharacterized protein (DUF1778 family)